MTPRVGRRDPQSLTGGYGVSFGGYLRTRLARCRVACRRAVVAVSPLHYDRGDMRGAYRLTRTLFDLVTLLLCLAGARLLLTGLFVTLVTTRPSLVAAFNLAVSALAGAVLVAATLCRARLARRRRAAGARLERL